MMNSANAVAPIERRVVPTDRADDVGQHYLLSSASKTLSITTVARLSEDEAREKFKKIRWVETDGEPVCPKCSHPNVYARKTRSLWECKACEHVFSLTSGTVFASTKIKIRDILLAALIFVNGAKGVSALQLSRDLGCAYKTAFILLHKLRECIGIAQLEKKLSGTVEVDGAYFGGHKRAFSRPTPGNSKRRVYTKYENRRVVIVARERGGSTTTFVGNRESDGVAHILRKVEPGSAVNCDQAHAWDVLGATFDLMRVNHSREFAIEDKCTNLAESYFSRLRRSALGVHHHISGQYLALYAAEIAWREDNRRRPNGDQFATVLRLACRSNVESKFRGYWQRARRVASNIVVLPIRRGETLDKTVRQFIVNEPSPIPQIGRGTASVMVARIRSAVRRAGAGSSTDDVTQDMAAAVLGGEIDQSEIERCAREFVKDHARRFSDFGMVQLESVRGL